MRATSRQAHLVLVGAHAKVLDGFTGVLGTTEQEGVASGGSTQSKLVQCQALTTSGNNTSAGSGGEAQGGDGDLGDFEKAVVVGDGTDNDDGLVGLVIAGDLGLDARERNRRSVDAGHKKTTQNNLGR